MSGAFSNLTQRQRTALTGASIAFAVAAWLGNRLSWLAWHVTGDAVTQWTTALANADLALRDPLPSLAACDLLSGAVVGAVAALAIGSKLMGKKQFREGREYGSARWGQPADIKGFADANPDDNLILSATERLALDDSGKPPEAKRNKNVVVVGSSGSGKTRFYVLPNLMQASRKASYVVTDPKGTVARECGNLLERRGFAVKVLDLVDMGSSLHYNPLAYVHSDQDALKLVNAIIANTKGEGEKASEDFWVKAERLYLSALVSYVCELAPEDERNFATLLELVNQSEAREDDEDFRSPVDELFAQLERTDPGCFAARQYAKYRQAAGKTAKSILISVGARMAPFDIAGLRELTAYDELELELVGEEPTALFITTSDSDATFDFVAAVLYSQMFNLLLERADKVHGGRLPRHVHFLLDEFANLGTIPRFERLIATIRSRNMSCSVILQSLSQLKGSYKDHAETIQGNCDTMVFLGGREPSTLKDMSEALGRETIDLMNESDTRGANRSFGQSYQKTGRELMTRDELAVMPNGKCIVQVRALRPFYSDKYDIRKHPRYKLLAEASGGGWRQRPSGAAEFDPDEPFEFFEGEEIEI